MRIVFAEDNYLVREGTAALLETVDGLELVASVGDAELLLAAVAEYAPDVVLTDIRMPPTHTDEGIRAAKQIRAEHPAIGVVVLSQFVEEAYAYDLLKDGAEKLGYILKERIADLDATTAVGYGDNWYAFFSGQIIVETSSAFVLPGDSGSLVVTDDGNANPVGLLFAGNAEGTMAIVNPIDSVLQYFHVAIDGK